MCVVLAPLCLVFVLFPLCLLSVQCLWMFGDLGCMCVCVCIGSVVSFVCCPVVWAPWSLFCMMLAPMLLVSVVMAALLGMSGVCLFRGVISMINVLAVVLVSFLQHAAGLGLSSLSMQYASMLFVMSSLAGLLSRRRLHGQTQQPAATAMG